MPTILTQLTAIALLTLATIGLGTTGPAQREREGPEQVIRSLMLAIYSNDVDSYNRLTIPHPLRGRLTDGGRVNQAKLNALKEDPDALQIIVRQPPMYRGQNVEADAKGEYPVGTTAFFVVAHGGGPMVVTVARRADGWKVDPRWWIAMTELASGKPLAPDSPELAIRSLLAAMLRLDRVTAARFLALGADVEILFAAAPRDREPSGVLEAAAAEMPLVELEPGEFVRMPSGRIVEGTKAADRKLLVGQFGPVEMPFVVTRDPSGWRVEAEPYFTLMTR